MFLEKCVTTSWVCFSLVAWKPSYNLYTKDVFMSPKYIHNNHFQLVFSWLNWNWNLQTYIPLQAQVSFHLAIILMSDIRYPMYLAPRSWTRSYRQDKYPGLMLGLQKLLSAFLLLSRFDLWKHSATTFWDAWINNNCILRTIKTQLVPLHWRGPAHIPMLPISRLMLNLYQNQAPY